MTGPLRILGVGHLVVAVALLPISLFLGLGLTPFLLVVPLWFIVLGVWLWRPSETLRGALKATHVVAAPFAVWICAYGIFALRAAEESAEGGGGLLGAFGLIPIVAGILSGVLSVVSLAMIRAWPSEPPA
jgi:hypothetical protein